MIIAEYSVKTNLSATKIWNNLTNVNQWKNWDETIEFSELDEPLGNESIGIIKHKNHEPTSFMVVEYDHLHRLVEIRKSYFGKFKLYREIVKGRNGMVTLTQKIEILNTKSVIFSPFISHSLKSSLARSVNNLLRICMGRKGQQEFEVAG